MRATLQTLAFGFIATCALAAPALAAPRTISWSGEVDNDVVIRVSGDHVGTRAIHGADAKHVTARVDDPLPAEPIHVWLSDVTGRGTVEVVREPSAENNYTAVIRIMDPQDGRGYYSFNLNWRGGRRHHDGYRNDGDRDDNR